MSFSEILKQMWDAFVKFYIGRGLLWTGIGYTLLLSAIAVFFGTLLGSLMAIGKRSKFKPLVILITAVVEVLRGTPALLQLYVAYFLVPMMLKIRGMNPMISVAVAMSLNSAAYVSEIIRSGIEAVDKGQTEASRALGLTGKTTMIKIVLPQAVKNILPALGNEFITVIKETSLAATFYVGDLMTTYNIINGVTHQTLPILFDIAIFYFVMTFSLSKLLGVFERRMKKRA